MTGTQTVRVRYIVHDVDAVLAFYTTHLGFEELMHPAPGFAMLALARLLGRRYATSFVGFRHPGRHVEHRLADFHVDTRALGILCTAGRHRS
jgi:catechol 2,3-dioxygenase-like lactoylglutathione lyase family enzyme